MLPGHHRSQSILPSPPSAWNWNSPQLPKLCFWVLSWLNDWAKFHKFFEPTQVEILRAQWWHNDCHIVVTDCTGCNYMSYSTTAICTIKAHSLWSSRLSQTPWQARVSSHTWEWRLEQWCPQQAEAWLPRTFTHRGVSSGTSSPYFQGRFRLPRQF